MEKGFLRVPMNSQEWQQISNGFEKRWNFPNCLGCIDGKHVIMQAPAKSGSLFFNYKKTFFIVLLAACNENYRFTMVDIGEAGRQSDGGVFSNSNLGNSILKNLLPVPRSRKLDSTGTLYPYVFLADDAFPFYIGSNNYSEETKAVRDAFCKYFGSKEGEVPWQWHAYAVDVNKR